MFGWLCVGEWFDHTTNCIRASPVCSRQLASKLANVLLTYNSFTYSNMSKNHALQSDV